MGPHSMMPGDVDAVKGVQLRQGTLRRVWVFARPYKSTIVIFLVAILVAALLGARRAVRVQGDHRHGDPAGRQAPDRHPGGDRRRRRARRRRAGDRAAVVQRPRRRGADLRPAPDAVRQGAADADRLLHPHADRCRSRRGSTTTWSAPRPPSRARSAAWSATSSCWSPRSSRCSPCEWQLTLLTLVVLPMFVIPARRVGRRLQEISREQMAHNAAMNTQMTERFNVAGRDAGQAVRSGQRENEHVRTATPTASATPASARRCTAGCSSSRSASSARSARRRSTASARIWWSTATSRPARSSPSPRSSPASTSRSPG